MTVPTPTPPRAPRPDAPPPRTVVLLSGGLDSAVAAACARADGFEVHALTVRYGQRHAVELEAARRVAAALGVASHRVVDLDLRAIGGSALTADLPLPPAAASASAGAGPAAAASAVPATYVPARNTILLGLALAHAEVLGAADVYLGVSSVDYSGYPDCRPAFIEAFERLARVATKAGAEDGVRFRIHAPLQHLTKAETIRRGLELGVDFSLTHTCYDPAPDGAACGRCDSCRLRREGFAAAGVPDPTRYAPPATAQPATVRVLELYRTLQGETTFAGAPCVIVRCSGCPLRCSYCDTAYARQSEGLELSVEEVVRSVAELGPGIVAVTGGEPLAQPGALALLRALCDTGRTVLLETSGAFDIAPVDPRVRRILDVKTPGSGMEEHNRPENRALLRPTDELKLVLVDRADYEWSRELVRRERLAERCTVLFSPVHGKLAPAELAKWILDDGLPVRLQLQLHRLVWPDRDRGV
ncbi:MAG: 7-cyano-7-deazaguanine synthase QueC [Deltaproteobacteria bacterium]|nr:7-cyano-7-deazaguanine synthase QueC [Deltaproteobacteria bacterium]